MEPESDYARFCPTHRAELQAVTPVMDYPHHAEELWSAPELHCEEGNHMVGRACDTDHWLVIHKPTGLICYEANEDGSRFVNSISLLVEPEDLEPPPAVPLSGHLEGAERFGEPVMKPRTTRFAA